jgi:CheY-like chemotaxis protein/HPt (histidine-containing phosphotransfer) domain-containing protein
MDTFADPTTFPVSPIRAYHGEQTPSGSSTIISPHLRVLVADDDPVNREVVELMLSRLDQQADLAENGLEALDALFARRYDIVLMDIQMPELDGIAATRRIRSELGQASQPEVIAMTAGVTTEDRTRYRQAGMDAVLAKPLQLSELAAALDTRARRHQGAGPVTGTKADRWPDPPADRWPGGNSAFHDAGMHAVYDRSALDLLLAELGEEGDAVRRDLIETYLSGDGPRTEAIEAAGRDRSGTLLGSLAHELKSSSATLGLMALCDVAGRIDAELRLTPQSIDVAAAAAALLRECRRAAAVLAVIPGTAR